jgi:hypothetical protein
VGSRHVQHIRLGDHLCLPFANDDEQREVLTSYIADGLDKGQRVLYLADRTEPAAIDRWLSKRGVDGALAVARGQLDVRSAAGEDPVSVAGGIKLERQQARDAGYTGLRITGEMSWALRHPPTAGLLDLYESGIATTVTGSDDLVAICQYDERLFDSAAVHGYLAFHADVVRVDPLHNDRRLRVVPTFTPRGLKVHGIVDQSSGDGFAFALEHAARWPEPVLHIDLADLEFIDVAGVRAIVRMAESLAPGRRVQLDHLAPYLRKVLGVVGWDRTPGLTIGGLPDASQEQHDRDGDDRGDEGG